MEAASWISFGFGSMCQDLGTKEAEPREPGSITTLSGTEFVGSVIMVRCFTHPEEQHWQCCKHGKDVSVQLRNEVPWLILSVT